MKNSFFSRSGACARSTSILIALVGVASSASSHAQSGWNQTAAGNYDYNNSANWYDGSINGLWDTPLTLAGAQTATFSSDTVLSTGWNFRYNAGGNFSLTGTTAAVTVTLAGDIAVNTSGNQIITIGSTTGTKALNVDLGGASRTLTVGSGKTLTFTNVISNGGITAAGGTINLAGVNTYSGATVVNLGVLALTGAVGSSANSDFTVNAATSGATTLQFNSTTNGNTGTTRAKNVALDGSGNSGGAILSVTGNSTANSNDVISGTLTAASGFSTVTVSSNAARNARLTVSAYEREAGNLTLFRGTNLGTNAIGSGTNSANIVFTTAPTLSGTGALGTTTAGIIKGAYGDASSGGNGTGLVTYDSSVGVRRLSGSEYVSTITDGQTQLDNALLTNSSGAGVITTTLSSTTSVNSLSLGVSGTTANSGLTVDGAGTLTVASGMIYASQLVTGTNVATNAMTLSVGTLDLNGQEGGIVVFTNGINNGNTVAPLYISSVLTNDGGNGVTFGGNGQTILSGSGTNTYAGVTTLNSGILRLDKTAGVQALTTDLVMNGGTLLKNNNSIADTASVTINGGSFVMDTTTSSGNNGSNETINNLTMTGGRVQGSGGTNSSLTVNGNMTLSGGLVQLNAGGKVFVSGTSTFTGGVLTAQVSSSTVTFTGTTSLNAVNITNVASGTYTPISVSANATNRGAVLALNGDVTFTGNGTNTNTVKIDSSNIALANQGFITLSGTRTFNVGDGAAEVDLAIIPALTNATTDNGLTKTGAGVLALNGANTYTGATTVSAGTLLINGSSVSAVSVTGGVFGGTGTMTSSVSIGNSGTLAPGNSPGMLNTGNLALTGTASTIAMEISGTGAGQYDQVNVTGTVDLDGNGKIEVTMLSFVPLPTDIYFLILNDGADAIDGTLNGIAQGGSFTSGGYTWQVSYLGSSVDGTFTGGNDLALQLVPEPSTWLLLTGGLMVVTFLRRRRA